MSDESIAPGTTPLGGRWPDAALFDLDGTLMDREPLMTAAVRKVLTNAGVDVDEAHLGGTVGRAWTDVHLELERTYGSGWTFDDFIDQVFDEADGLLAGGFPTRALEGGRELVERFRTHGVPVAIVTGSLRREVPGALAYVGITDHVTAIFAAEDYGVGKPDPECYLLAARTLDADPARCVVFEDSVHGVAAGLAAGMRVIATEDANQPPEHPAHQDLSAAHVVVGRLSDVRDDDLVFDAT